jgi:hypothetical protein
LVAAAAVVARTAEIKQAAQAAQVLLLLDTQALYKKQMVEQ